MNIHISNKLQTPEEMDFEVVERKGIGHPDTLADGLAEKISVEYSKYCLEHFGFILHHNVDKVTIMGGLSKVDWNSGEFLKPVRVLVNGRMSASFKGEQIPLEEIQQMTVKKYLNKRLPRLDTDKWLLVINETTQYSRNPKWFNPTSEDDLPEYKKRFANDTSAVVGVWPLTAAENLTLELEGIFYDSEDNPKFPYIGQDIKVMTVRRNDTYNITMCIPFFAQEITNFEDYQTKKDTIYQFVDNHIKKSFPTVKDYELFINTQDQNVIDKTTVKKLYFVAGGSSTDFGEEGCVGRGNNRRGIIPMFRTYSMEAAWGKNPVYHVGKVYGLIVDSMAKEIAEELECKVEILIITNNGDPFFSPHNIYVNTSKKVDHNIIENKITEILSRRNWTDQIVFEEKLIPKPKHINE
jgi:S-adenosylmethionine synthetase